MMVRGLMIGLLAGAAHAGTVTTIKFGDVAWSEVVVANGVAAQAVGGFVLYQHGAWTPRPSPAAAMSAEASPPAVIPVPVTFTSCGLQAPSPHRGLAVVTAANRAVYWPLIRDAECRHALPAGLLDAVVFQESRYRPLAVSPAGAGGLTQLMPRTASGLGVADRFEPAANIEGGARYLRSMLDRYRSVPLAVAAYNAGRGSVDRWGGIPRNRETPGYVRKVLGFFNEAGDEVGVLPAAAPVISRAITLSFGSTAD